MPNQKHERLLKGYILYFREIFRSKSTPSPAILHLNHLTSFLLWFTPWFILLYFSKKEKKEKSGGREKRKKEIRKEHKQGFLSWKNIKKLPWSGSGRVKILPLHHEWNRAHPCSWSRACLPADPVLVLLLFTAKSSWMCVSCHLTGFGRWERNRKGEARVFLLLPMCLWRMLWPGLWVSFGSIPLPNKSNVVPTSLDDPNH